MKTGATFFICALLAAATTHGQNHEGAPGTSNVLSLTIGVQNQEQAPKSTNAAAPVRLPIQNLTDKMSRIIIPEINFRQANIHDAVAFLVKAGIAGDTATTDPRLKGVNIILNLKGPGALPEITFTAREVSLLNALKAITQVSGLRYYVEGNAVMIVRAD